MFMYIQMSMLCNSKTGYVLEDEYLGKNDPFLSNVKPGSGAKHDCRVVIRQGNQ